MRRKIIIALAGIVTAMTPVLAATWYVSPDGNDANSGESWALARKTIQGGVNAANGGDTVLVTNGNYVLTNNVNITVGIMVKSVNGANVTIVNGNYPVTSNRCFTVNHTGAIVDGFNITNGYTSGLLGGGGVYITFGTVTNCVIMGNNAMSGGGVYVANAGGGTVANCAICGNSANYGGGLYVSTGGKVANCTVTGNNAIVSYGGGMMVEGGTVSNCTISGNIAHYGGGGVMVRGGSVAKCAISNNITYGSYGGGGVYMETVGTGNGMLENCTISGNTADIGGGVKLNGGFLLGGGIVVNCTITGNNATNGAAGGVYNDDGQTINSIIWNNHGTSEVAVVGTGSFSYCASASLTGGVGNITSDPCFSDPGAWVGSSFAGGNFRLQSASPCINAGTNQEWMTGATDLDGNARIIGGIVDMGVYEFIGAPTPPSAPAGVSATDGTYTDKVRVTWSAASGALSYQVWRYESNNSGSALKISSPDPAETNYDDPSATPGTIYYYWVKAVNALGASGFSSPDSGYASIAAPSTPDGVSASDGTYTDKVAVAWSAASGADGYVIWRNTSDNSGGATGIGATSGTTFDDTGTAPNATNYYWVKATNAGGDSAFSSSDAGWRTEPVIPPVTYLDPPNHVSASDGTYTDKVAVAWSAVNGASGYQVWRAPENNVGAAVNLGNATLPGYDDNSTTVRSATMFYYWVKAWNSVTTSEFSNVESGFCRMIADPEIISGQPAVGDYDGDGKADPAVYNLTNGRLFVWLSSAEYILVTPVTTFQVASGDLPATGDFDGDGRADPAVFNRVAGSWHVWLSSASYYRAGPIMCGVSADDIPVPADYDGDRKTDPAVYQASSGGWYIWLSSAVYMRVGPIPFQQSAVDVPVPGQFDAGHSADPAVYQQAGGAWYIWLSSAGYFRVGPATFATTDAHLPVPADYDGDQLCDPAAYVPSFGKWRMWMSGSSYGLTEMELK